MAFISGASGPPSGGSDYSKTWGVSPQYVVTLSITGDGGWVDTFETTIDETLSMQLGSQWAAPFENIIQELIGGAAAAAGVPGKAQAMGGAAASMGGDLFGVKNKYKEFSFQTWQSSDQMRLNIPFTFIALTDPGVDVRDKVVKMLKLVAPTQIGPLLKAPGPVRAKTFVSGRNVKLQIGNLITLEPCIIRDVQVQFDNTMGQAGIPLKAKVNLDIESWYTCFTTQDIDKMFSGQSQNGELLGGGTMLTDGGADVPIE